jgi:hypothetical protein
MAAGGWDDGAGGCLAHGSLRLVGAVIGGDAPADYTDAGKEGHRAEGHGHSTQGPVPPPLVALPVDAVKVCIGQPRVRVGGLGVAECVVLLARHATHGFAPGGLCGDPGIWTRERCLGMACGTPSAFQAKPSRRIGRQQSSSVGVARPEQPVIICPFRWAGSPGAIAIDCCRWEPLPDQAQA